MVIVRPFAQQERTAIPGIAAITPGESVITSPDWHPAFSLVGSPAREPLIAGALSIKVVYQNEIPVEAVSDTTQIMPVPYFRVIGRREAVNVDCHPRN